MIDPAHRLRILRPLSLIVPLLTMVLVLGLLVGAAKLDINFALLISVAIAAMEWLFLAGTVRKLEQDARR